MTTLWLPEVDGADAAAAGVFIDEHGGKVALLYLLKQDTEELDTQTQGSYFSVCHVSVAKGSINYTET